MSRSSHSFGPREQTGVDGVNDRLCANLPTAEIPPVEALDGILAARYPLEFQVDVALGVRVERDVDDVAVFLFALGAYVVFEFFNPTVAFFSIAFVSGVCQSSVG